MTAALIALRLLTIQYIHVSYLCRYFMQIRYVTYLWVYVLYYNIFCFMQLSRAEDGPSELTDDVLLPQMVEDPDADSRDKDEFLLVEEADERASRRRGRRFGRPNCRGPFYPFGIRPFAFGFGPRSRFIFGYGPRGFGPFRRFPYSRFGPCSNIYDHVGK